MIDMPVVLLTPRIEACLDAGDAASLRKKLATWSIEELNLVAEDLRQSYRIAVAHIEARYRESMILMRAEARPELRAELERCYINAKAGIAEVYGEISQVVEFYRQQLSPEATQ